MADTQEFRVACAFCGATFTPEMEVQLDSTSSGCPTCGYGATAWVTVEIRCDSCGRIVYRKEVEAD